eukprot:4365939-Pyramimonas_sp.AAC.1
MHHPTGSEGTSGLRWVQGWARRARAWWLRWGAGGKRPASAWAAAAPASTTWPPFPPGSGRRRKCPKVRRGRRRKCPRVTVARTGARRRPPPRSSR